MSKLKDELLARKKQIETQLKEYNELKAELEEVNKALTALDPPREYCDPRCSGCSVCRSGPDYR